MGEDLKHGKSSSLLSSLNISTAVVNVVRSEPLSVITLTFNTLNDFGSYTAGSPNVYYLLKSLINGNSTESNPSIPGTYLSIKGVKHNGNLVQETYFVKDPDSDTIEFVALYESQLDNNFITPPKMIQFGVTMGTGKYLNSKVVTIDFKGPNPLNDNRADRIIYVNK